jgi:hypothetical protein
MMIAVALVAIVLWPVHHWLERPYYEEKAKFHGLMAELCAVGRCDAGRQVLSTCSVLADYSGVTPQINVIFERTSRL